MHATSWAAATNLALNRPVVASSVFRPGVDKRYVNDGSMSTRWTGNYSDPQWIYIDLGTRYAIQSVVLKWENAYGKAYSIQVSDNASSWTTVYSTTAGNGGTDTISLNTAGRYVRMYGTKRGTNYGYSIYEFEVYGTNIPTAQPPVVSLRVSPTSIIEGQSAVLTWSSTNASSCVGTNFTSPNATSGTVTVSPTATTTYSIACTGAGGTVNASVTVNVTLLPPLTATCSVLPTAVYTGDPVTWTATASGGNGTYTYNWNGTDGLSGTTVGVSKIYTTAGVKSAQVTVSSGAKRTTADCLNTVQVTEPDRQPPTVAVTAPTNGSTKSGSIAVSGTASDNIGVVGVQFFLDATTLLQDEKIAPYSFGWNTVTTTDGTHTITAVARDAAGNRATSTSITFIVRNAPTATLTSAATTITEGGSTTLSWSSVRATTCTGTNFTTDGATSGTVTISPTATTTYAVTCAGVGGTANASTTVNVALLPPVIASCSANQTTAYTGDPVTWTATASGGTGAYAYTWSGTDGVNGTTNPLAMTYTTPGEKTAQVSVTSGTKSTTVSCTQSVVVSEPDRQAPSVDIVSPLDAATVAGPVVVTARASDNVGVTGVQYQLDGVNLDTEKTTTPYGLLWDTLLISDGAHTLIAIARDAAGNTATSSPVTVMVGNIPVVSFTTDMPFITEGQSATLSWNATNAARCVGVGFDANDAVTGSVRVSPTATTTYNIACTGIGGTITATVTVGVAVLPPISGTCSADQTTLYTGDPVTWTTTVSGGTGAYTYMWNGTDGLTGTSSVLSIVYTAVGMKVAQVTIVSGPKIVTLNCDRPVEVRTAPRLGLSDRVRVNTDTSLNVRDSANGTVVGQQDNTGRGIIVEGPVYTGSLWWWNVDYDTGTDGWSAEDFLLSEMPIQGLLPSVPETPNPAS